ALTVGCDTRATVTPGSGAAGDADGSAEDVMTSMAGTSGEAGDGMAGTSAGPGAAGTGAPVTMSGDPTRPCPAGLVCLGGMCQTDPCTAAPAGACAAGSACHASCIRTSDPCAGKTCPDQQTCVDGDCIAGCFDVPCNGVKCAANQYCDAGTGK